MSETNMANYSLRRILLLATVVSAIILAGSCKAEENGDAEGVDSDASHALPEVQPSDTGATVDANSQEVTTGVTGYISPMFWPFTFTFLEAINTLLSLFTNQELPCTIWSLAPPRIACTPSK